MFAYKLRNKYIIRYVVVQKEIVGNHMLIKEEAIGGPLTTYARVY